MSRIGWREWLERIRQEALVHSLGQVTCPGRHDLIFDGEPQAVESWCRCPKCGAEA